MAKRTKVTQEDLVLDHLKHHGYITPTIAANTYAIWRLAARIYNLRKQGYLILCSMREDARGHKYGRYTMAKAN